MSYTKTTWANGDVINAQKLNNLENGVYANDTNIGDLSDLDTTEKNTLVAAINEAAQSGGEGLTDNERALILTLFSKAAYAEDDAGDAYGELKDMWLGYDVSWVGNNYTHGNTDTLAKKGSTYTSTITSSQGYELSTVVATMGGATVQGAWINGTVTIPNVTGDIVITVTTIQAEVSSISAVYTQSGTVYDTDSLDSLKSDLVVTAAYVDQSTSVVPSTDYTLSGTLAEGTSTVTVTYGGKTTTFTVTVTQEPPYDFYDYLQGDGTAFIDTGLSTKTYLADAYKKYVKFRLGTIQNEKTVFGARNAWGTTGVFIQINTASADRMNICFGNAWTKDTSPIADDLIEIELDHPNIVKNGETLGTVSNASVSQTSTSATIPLFCLWGGSSGSGSISYNGGYVSQFFPYKIYRFTVTDKLNDTVIADMKPAMRISDNAVGMYDTVRDEFFTNARGTGVLTLGNDEA